MFSRGRVATGLPSLRSLNNLFVILKFCADCCPNVCNFSFALGLSFCAISHFFRSLPNFKNYLSSSIVSRLTSWGHWVFPINHFSWTAHSYNLKVEGFVVNFPGILQFHLTPNPLTTCFLYQRHRYSLHICQSVKCTHLNHTVRSPLATVYIQAQDKEYLHTIKEFL